MLRKLQKIIETYVECFSLFTLFISLPLWICFRRIYFISRIEYMSSHSCIKPSTDLKATYLFLNIRLSLMMYQYFEFKINTFWFLSRWMSTWGNVIFIIFTLNPRFTVHNGYTLRLFSFSMISLRNINKSLNVFALREKLKTLFFFKICILKTFLILSKIFLRMVKWQKISKPN